MNALSCSNTETDVAIPGVPGLCEDRYATAPLKTVLPIQPAVDENSLHASFDAALSDRVLALNHHWNSHASLHTPAYTMDALLTIHTDNSTEPLRSYTSQHAYVWLQRIIYACLALMLLLAGFDLMGLLVLHMH